MARMGNPALRDGIRDKIIESACEVFAKVGFHNVAIREIRSQAGAIETALFCL